MKQRAALHAIMKATNTLFRWLSPYQTRSLSRYLSRFETIQDSERPRSGPSLQHSDVIGGVKQAGLTEGQAQGAIYYPYVFRTDDKMFVAVRASLPPESLALTLEKEVRQVDADVLVNDLRSMERTTA
jgi:hypothetical protein